MRIFYASDTTPNGSLSSNIWRNNLYQPLIDLGHEVIEFDYDMRKTFQNTNREDPIQKKFIEKNRPRISKALLEQIQKAHTEKPINVFFSYFYDACVLPETIDVIKSMGVTTINWYCNGSYQLNLVSQISPHYDYCLVPEEFRLNDYKILGARPLYCQEAANPNIYKPYDLAKTYDVTFIGQAYGERPDYIDYLLKNNIDIHVWGVGWEYFTSNKKKQSQNIFYKTIKKFKKLFSAQGLDAIKYKLILLSNPKHKKILQKLNTHTSSATLPDHIVGPPLPDLEMVKLYSRSKINIGFSSCGNTHKEKEKILQVRLRDFEVPMSNGFYMVEYMKELEQFFDIGKEIVCYHDQQDLVDKIRYYLAHDEEREKIRLAGYQRCLQDHTWHKRFETVFKQIR